MFIELNEAQVLFAFCNKLYFHYCVKPASAKTPHDYSEYDNARLDEDELIAAIKGHIVICVHVDDYEEAHEELRALSSPEPKAPAPVMKKDYTSTQAPIATEQQGEPDYKALALLLIDLFEEKQDVDARIAAVKAKLLQ